MWPTENCQNEWFAVRVKSNREKMTAIGLEGKGYEVFLPTHRRTADGVESPSHAPLFPGYVFSRFPAARRLPILTLPGVVHIVGFGKTPAPINAQEIESLRILVEAGIPVEQEEYTVGQSVRIDRGPLTGATGVVTGRVDKRLTVSITLLQRSVSVLLDRDWINAAAD